MLKINSLLIILFIASQCAAQQKEPTGILISNWNTAWNTNDSAAIVSLMDDDVQFISGKMLLIGKDAVAKKFVSGNYKELADLKTEKIKSFTDKSFAYETGRYMHNIKQNNANIAKAKGTYSFVWERSKDNQFKLKVIEIEEWPSKK